MNSNEQEENQSNLDNLPKVQITKESDETNEKKNLTQILEVKNNDKVEKINNAEVSKSNLDEPKIARKRKSEQDFSNNQCQHPTVFKDLCAVCGQYVPSPNTSTYVSMVHGMPQLRVNEQLAQQLGLEDQLNCYNNRKLVLLVDLDETVVHTTTSKPGFNECAKDIVGYNLEKGRFYTKLRPNAQEFIKKLSEIFEMHVVTMGERSYAIRILGFLDPSKKAFCDRILTREQLLDAYSKSQNLKHLFPSGDELVVIIDDRIEVWNNNEAHVWVRPYRFFGNTNPNVETTINNSGPPPLKLQKLEKIEGIESPDVPDDYFSLKRIQEILIEVHRKFYEEYDKLKEQQSTIKLNVKTVISEMKREVLKNEIIVFSGLIQLNSNPEKFDLYREAVRFGAKIQSQVDKCVTTVVASRLNTEKCKEARRHQIPIVTSEWLWNTIFDWKKQNKDNYLLINQVSHKSQEIQKKQKVQDIQKSLNKGSLSLNPNYIDEDLIKSMEKEVEEALKEDEDICQSRASNGSSSTEPQYYTTEELDEMADEVEKLLDEK